MKILLLNQYYLPDVAATGQLLGDLAESMVRQGHEVHVICSLRAYRGGKLKEFDDSKNGRQGRPVVHRVTEGGIGDVVGGQRVLLDCQQNLPVVQFWRVAVLPFGVGQVSLVYPKAVHVGYSVMGNRFQAAPGKHSDAAAIALRV